MLRKRLLAVILFALPLVSSQFASAQTTADIIGTVKDETGGVLPGAEVVVTNVDTGVERSVTVDADGRYRVTNLLIGQYKVVATLSGFQAATRLGIGLTIGREALVDLVLKVGDLSESVVVTSDAPLVDTSSGSLGGIVDRETILQIPLNGRDLTGLVMSQPGTVEATTASTGTSQGFSRKFSIGGARPTDNAVLLDGTEVKSMDQGVPAGVSGAFLGAEAIQEFKVERNSYSAQYGGNSGGVINVVSKSGSNDFNGSVYEFHRNDALDATNFRATPTYDTAGNYTGQAKPDFMRNQFGVSAGGRIIRNKMFFFGNYEGLRETNDFTDFVRTLTPQARLGILPGRTIPVNPAVAPYLALWPVPGVGAVDNGDGTARIAVNQTQPTDENFYQLRVDHNFSQNDAIFGRITRQISERTTPEVINRWTHLNRVYNTFLTIEERKILSSKLLNTFRFGFNRRGISENSKEDPGVDPALFMVPVEAWRFPLGAPPIMGSLSVTNLSPVGLGRGWADRATNNLQFMNDLVYSRGAHSFKLGVNWLNTQMAGENPSRPGGEAFFNSIDNFLLGRPNQFRGDILPTQDAVRDLRWNLIGYYVQDDWKVNDRLTVNYGLRHEWYTVPTEKDDKIGNLKDPLHDTTLTLGSPWWENPSFKTFQPRMNLSWDPTGSGKMAVRAGGGFFYNHIQPEAFRQAAYRTAPFLIESNIQGTVPANIALPGPIPFPKIYDFVIAAGAQAGDVQLFPYSWGRNPHMIQWNVNVQREVLPQTSLTVGYAGSRGFNMTNQVHRNTATADLIDGRYVFPLTATRPNLAPSFAGLDLLTRENASDSWYQSLQVEMQRRFAANWQMQLNYTWSRTIDETSAYGPTYTNDPLTIAYYWNTDMKRGLAAFHTGQRFSATGIWTMPFGRGQKIGSEWPAAMDAILGGWQVSGALNLAEGTPLTITMGRRSALAALGLANDQPDLIPGGNNNPIIGDPDKYFDASQFAFLSGPLARTIGNLGRNTLIGPPIKNVDLSFSKFFPLYAGSRLQFRTEIFNLLNRANMGSPDTNVFNGTGAANGNAGFISSTSTRERQIQLGLRVEW